jgi:hypothetical protein
MSSFTSLAADLTGRVIDSTTSNPVASARVTLFTPDLQFFRENRTDLNGNFQFINIDGGTYQLGVAARGYEYQERTIAVSIIPVPENFTLSAEINGGRWSIIGNTDPELLDGSGSGNLLATGEIFFCHNTIDPIVFDPVTGAKLYPPSSGTPQGCYIVTLNTDGGLFLTGGSIGGNAGDPIVKIAKTYWRNTNSWVRNADMNLGRWYPGLVRLPNERLLILGGELDGPEGRTNTCEIYDPVSNSWSYTGSFNLPTEFPPTLVLFTGEVFKSWRYPELYTISTGSWRAAANMIQTRIGQDTVGRADHEIVYLPDGRVMAVGISPASLDANTRFCEFYDPSNNTWTLGPNPRALRSRPETSILPDGRVLSFGGQYSGPTPAPVPLANAGIFPDCTKVTDLYDPASNSWRAMADMNRYVHWHNVTTLVPDGRVVATGGAGLTSNRSFAGDDSSIEAFEPPYLFRGVRPRIDSLSTTNFVLGSSFTTRVSLTDAIPDLVLVSTRNATHWVDGGPQRHLTLNVTQKGSDLVAVIPNDPVRFLPGWYMLFAMVDDIPSVGRMVRIIPHVPPTPTPTPAVTPTPMPTRLANISTRLRVETGDNVLIGGFIITGSAQKRLILRAIGPSLPLGDRLVNPTLELYNGAGQQIASNDNWQDAENRQEIIDTNIPPTSELESAILRNFEPGAYTAIVRGVANGTGVGLVEVYDLGSVQDSKLANLSSRGLVQTGDNVMIGGLIVTGSSSQRVILRAIGPSLPVNGKLLDPFLQLYDGNGALLQSNDSWRSDQEAEIIATTIPPSDNSEPAIVRNLPPAAYTAIVSGVNATTGVALVEVYALP